MKGDLGRLLAIKAEKQSGEASNHSIMDHQDVVEARAWVLAVCLKLTDGIDNQDQIDKYGVVVTKEEKRHYCEGDLIFPSPNSLD